MFQDRKDMALQVGRSQQVKTARLDHLQPFPFTCRSAEDDHRQIGVPLQYLFQCVVPGALVKSPSAKQSVVCAFFQLCLQLTEITDWGGPLG